jgi:methylthioribose-1-phosphate isomerase
VKVSGQPYRTIWLAADGWAVEIIDQTRLPHTFETFRLETVNAAARAIADMLVRGAPLIGATAAYGMCLAARADSSLTALRDSHALLLATRPTAVNLRWALDDMLRRLTDAQPDQRIEIAYRRAAEICDEDVAICEAIGNHGLKLFEEAAAKKKDRGPLNVLTHCNAGWLATVDWGTALAPIYKAQMPACQFTSGSTKPVRATRAPI